jgi:4-phytase / acid phosphatase
MIRQLLLSACLVLSLTTASYSRTHNAADDTELKFVVYLSRHGVRSPTAKPSQYSGYSTAPWPTWDVPPGYLTKHGYHLMEIFGAYDRMMLAQQGLLSATGCDDAGSVTFYADSDQRTRETGKALAIGLFPGCNVPVQSLAEGTSDPLFHPVQANLAPMNSSLATSAIAGRIGNNPKSLTEAHRTQLASLDKLLATCGTQASSPRKRTSLFEIPTTLAPGSGDHLADLRGPLNTASTLTENMLLEYTEGMEASNVGWGCVDGATLRSLIDLHTAATDFTQRTPAIAKMQASNLLDQIHRVLQQAVTHKSVPGALGKPTDRALFLIGHDTNLSNIAGLLNMTWIIDGRRDDTPPGGALMIELWKKRQTEDYSVRLYYTAQTLEQMRSSASLSAGSPPEQVPIFLPGCSKEDFYCTWTSFSKAIEQAIDPRYVSSK